MKFKERILTESRVRPKYIYFFISYITVLVEIIFNNRGATKNAEVYKKQ